jgi:hypothetical protein
MTSARKSFGPETVAALTIDSSKKRKAAPPEETRWRQCDVMTGGDKTIIGC